VIKSAQDIDNDLPWVVVSLSFASKMFLRATSFQAVTR
jgi:hypothetical protein